MSQAWQEGWAFLLSLQHQLIKPWYLGMNGDRQPGAMLCREVVIRRNSISGMIYFEVLETGSLQMVSRHQRLLLTLDGG